MNLVVSSDDLTQAFDCIDCVTHDGSVEFVEFCAKAREVVSMLLAKQETAAPTALEAGTGNADDGEEEEEEEDEDEPEIPEDFAGITDRAVLAKKILYRSLYQMIIGTTLVLLFSDPMVGVFSELGNRTSIPAFYISFVLAPLASNASELIAAYNYASKKTKSSITTSLTALQGAACMNNTLCLGSKFSCRSSTLHLRRLHPLLTLRPSRSSPDDAVFMALIFFKGLFWEFSAETISIVLVQVIVGVYSFKEHQYMRDGWVILVLYPASIFFVFVLEKVAGLN